MSHKEMAHKLVEAVGLSEAPIAIYYADEALEGSFQWNGQGAHFCSIGRMTAVRQGTPLAVDGQNPGCMGMAYYLGWNDAVRPGFEYFLAHDAEGKGERFKKTPELARTIMESRRFVPAKGRYCIFQRLADVPDDVTPEVVAVFGDGDEIAALVCLACYDRAGLTAVTAPFAAGCGSLVGEPRAQALQPEPKAVLGMFDPTVRPRMEKDLLTLAAPFARFVEMVENIPGSFLEIEPWLAIRDR